jgi:dihydrofolate synthase/folylpolyglutamate synthase
MVAAILQRHGLRTAAYTSPHLVSYRERVQVAERELDGAAFADAVQRASTAAERVNRTLAADDHVTQFELLTAAALWAMAEKDVDVAVVEAGLGGRFDATSVIDAQVTALTNVGLEHTRWLGPTISDIAEEKLAVVRPGRTLALGARIAPEALAVAERVAGERGARIVRADPAGETADGLPGAFQRRNLALARVVAAAHLDTRGVALSQDAVTSAARQTPFHGRLQLLDGQPPTVLDGAHNPDAVGALIESLPEVLPQRPLALVLGVLEDKDAAAMLGALLPLCQRAWFTAPPSARALSPAALQSLAHQLGFQAGEVEPHPASAFAAAREWALARSGGVLATGSVYLVGDLLAGVGDASASALGEASAHARAAAGGVESAAPAASRGQRGSSRG